MNIANENSDKINIGVISDTHGYLPAGLIRSLNGVDLIIHAGDFDHPEIYSELEKIAPVKAVRGNMDRHPGLSRFPSTEMFEIGGVYIYLIHDILQLDIDLPGADVNVLIHGHLHVPDLRERQGVLYINPGSPTSPRRGSGAGYVRLTIENGSAQAEWIPLG